MQVLQRHLAAGDTMADLLAAPTASRGASLPRFDTAVMEATLDDLASLKEEVYEVFRHHPELLPASLEGLSKGVRQYMSRMIVIQFLLRLQSDFPQELVIENLSLRADEHRELVRQQLLLLLKAGFSPLRFYVHDIRKYFYLGELLALVDLSLVKPHAPCTRLLACLQLWSCTAPSKSVISCVSDKMLHADGEDGSAVQSLGRQHPEPWHREAPQSLL